MAFKDQVINFILQGKDLFSSVAQKSEKAMLDLAAQSEKLNAQLDDIRKQQEAITTIDDLTAAVGKGERAYVDSTQALQHLQDEQKAAAKYAKQLADEQAAAASKSSQLEQDYQKLTTELAQYDAQVLATKDRIAQLSAEQTSGATASEQQAAAIAAAKADLLKLEQAQTDTKTSAQQLSTELEQQRLSLDSISSESDKASRTSAEYAAKVKLARGELSTLGTALNKNQRTLTEQKAVLDKAGISMDDMADASAKLKQQEAAAEVAIKDVNTRLQKHQKLLDESKKGANDFGGSIKSATTSLLAMAGAYVGVDRLWESLKSILETGDRFAAFNAQMTAMMGSVAAGEQATAWIKDFANNTGSKLESVQTAFAKLKAFGIDPMNGSLQAMTDYNAKLGGSQQDLEGIILAVGQAWAKQKLQGEEILQLVERGVPVWGLLEQATGKNAVQLAKLSQAGKLGQETIKALVDEMGKAADGQAALSLDRLGGQINVLSNNWDVFKGKIADQGLYTVAIGFLKDLNAKFDELSKNGQIKELTKQVSDFLSSLVKDGGSAIKGFLQNLQEVSTGVTAVASVIRIAFNVVTSIVATFAQASTAFFAQIMDGMATVMEYFGKQDIAAMYREKAEALRAVSKAFKDQVEQDAKDTEAALKNIGINITLSAENTADALDKVGAKSKEVAKSQQEVAKELAKAATDQAQKDLDAANKSVEAWKLRQQAANEYVNELKTKGVVGTKAFDDALNQLGTTTEQLKAKQDAQVVAQNNLAKAQQNLKDKTTEFLEQQKNDAVKVLDDVRQKFIDGKASVEEYTAAQDDAKKATENLANASKATNEEIIKILTSQAAWAENYANQAKLMFKKGQISAQEYAEAIKNSELATAALKAATDDSKEGVKEYELAMAKAGITTKKVYEEQAASAKETYQKVKDAMALGTASINEQKQAYLLWAEAEIKAAAASGKHVDAYVYQQAAALNLKNELQSLITKNYDAEASYAAMALQLDSTTKATDNLNQSQKSTADAVSQATAALDEQSAALTQVTQNITIFGSEQQSLTDQLDFSAKSVEELEARYRELGNAMATNIQVSSAWWKEAGKSASDGIAIERSLIVQTLRYRELMDAISSGTMTLDQLDHATKTVNNSFRDLDSNMLDNLRSAISDARSEMLALRDDLKTTQAELQDELDQLQGKQKDQELETLKQRQAELNQQLAEAKAAGDKEAIAAAEKSLQLAKQIYDTKKRQADLEAQAAKAEAAKTQAAANTATNTSNTSTATSTTAPPTTTTTVASASAMTATLYLVIDNKPQAVTTTQTDLNSLMAAINQAKLSSGG